MKGISPLIASVLLIVFTIGISTALLPTVLRQTNEPLDQTAGQNSLSLGCAGASFAILSADNSNSTLTLTVQNRGQKTFNSFLLYAETNKGLNNTPINITGDTSPGAVFKVANGLFPHTFSSRITLVSKDCPALRKSATISDPSLAGYWKLDETGGTDGNNLVNNPGFETYITTPGLPPSWPSTQGTPTIEKETSIVRSGLNAMKLTVTGTGSNGLVQILPSIVAGKSYYAEAWGRTNGVAISQPWLVILNRVDSVNTLSSPGTTAGSVYQKLSGTFTAATGKTYSVGLHQVGGSGGEVDYFDDVIVQEIQAKDSAGSNHGTLKGGTNTAGPTLATGKIGGAYDFDGTDDYVEIADGSPLDFGGTTTYSYAFWAKHISTPPSFQPTFMKGGFGAAPYGMLIVSDGSVRVYGNGSTAVISTAASYISFDSTWDHLVVTYNGSVAKLYKNGVLTSTSGPYTALAANNDPLYIGKDHSNSAYRHKGQFDDMRIYNRALNAYEIKALYNDGI